MSLIGQTVYHQALGTCTVLDFDKSGAFWLQGAVCGGWFYVNEFSQELKS